MLAYQAVGSGVSECVLALGFEKMEKGSLTAKLRRPHQPARPARAG